MNRVMTLTVVFLSLSLRFNEEEILTTLKAAFMLHY